jgi:hypothetical protein
MIDWMPIIIILISPIGWIFVAIVLNGIEGIVIATPLTRRMDKTIVQCIDILNP